MEGRIEIRPGRSMKVFSAAPDDEVLDHLTRQQLEQRLGPPSGLFTHVVQFADGTYGIRAHSWNQRCPHCRT